MSKPNKFSPEVLERAVRMVHEHRGEYPSLWAAIKSIAPKIGCVRLVDATSMPTDKYRVSYAEPLAQSLTVTDPSQPGLSWWRAPDPPHR